MALLPRNGLYGILLKMSSLWRYFTIQLLTLKVRQ